MRRAPAWSRSCTATTTARAIELPRGGTVLDPPTCRCWPARAGHDVVTSSGDTLLGADDKAGVAEIMAAVAHLAAHPELPRPTLKVGFTPDEEIGEGATLFDVERFGAACAYTLDGSQPGEIQDETFSGTEVDRRLRASTSTPAGRRASSSTPRGSRAAARASCPPTAHAGDDGAAARASSIRTSLAATPAARGGPLHRARLRRRAAGRAHRADPRTAEAVAPRSRARA